MNIKVIRYNFTDEYTEGKLYIDGAFFCDVIEDKDRVLTSSMSEDEILKKKVYGKTCIPYGEYTVILDYSNKFKKVLPHILNVKGFEGIRLHSGNEASQSLGCLLLGIKTKDGWVSNSRDTVKKFIELLNKEDKNIILTICKEPTLF